MVYSITQAIKIFGLKTSYSTIRKLTKLGYIKSETTNGKIMVDESIKDYDFSQPIPQTPLTETKIIEPQTIEADCPRCPYMGILPDNKKCPKCRYYLGDMYA